MMLDMRQMGDISGEARADAPGVAVPAVDPEGLPVLDGQAFDRELEAFIARSSSATTWHVERLLKVSDFETTELVEGAPAGCPAGRYVRKRIDAASGAGAAYRSLWDAQLEGKCPACVPRLIELGVQSDELTVVMEYVAGCTVGSVVTALGAGSAVAELVMPSLCRAVSALHAAFDPPLIHRDLKPSNVIMRSGEPVIIDFGSARQWREGAEADTSHFLTRCYAPPEQFGFGQTDVRSDVYALGKMLYFCLVGENPPNVCDVVACERAGVQGEIAHVICRACAFDPDARYDDAGSLGVAIGRALERCGAQGAPQGSIQEPRSRLHASARPEGDRPEGSRGSEGESPSAGSGVARGQAPREHAPREQVPDFSWDAGRRGRTPSQLDADAVWRALVRGVKGGLERIPHWLTALWNAFIALMMVVLVVGSVFAIVSPNAQDARLPLWFRALQYTGVCVVSPGAVGYLLLDKRPLRERIAWFARVKGKNEVLMALVALILGIAIPLFAGSLTGLI